MPTPPGELRRGRIVYALFPFASDFPLELADGRTYQTVEQFAAAHRGSAAKLVVEARLRPVLLLHDGTRGAHGNVVCLRVNSVKPTLELGKQTWERIVCQQHPFFFYLQAGRYGLLSASVIAIGAIGTVNKSALLGRSVGALTQHEMRQVNERLARVLQLELAPLISARAVELLRRAGISVPPQSPS